MNYRTFFMEEGGKVYYRFGRNSICSAITIEKMNEILPRHPDLEKKFKAFKKTTMLQTKPFPLDYIMNLPSHLRTNDPERTTLQSQHDRLENILKNVAIRRLTEIRAIKAKPSFKEMIVEYMQKKSEKDERARIRIKE